MPRSPRRRSEQLAVEAREQRLLPGRGELPLRSLLEALPGALLVAEVPIGAQYPALSPVERARLVYRSTSSLLTGTAPNGVGPPGGGPFPEA